MSRCQESKRKIIKLNSPNGGKPMLMSIKLQIEKEKHLRSNRVMCIPSSDSESDEDDVENLIKAIEFIGKDNTALPIDLIIPDKKALQKSLSAVEDVCIKYNRCVNAIRFLEDGTSLPQGRINKHSSRELTNFVIQQCYKRSVKDPTKLNKYDPFSPEVYGETSFELICLIIDSLNITQDDVFLDLGSGVGQVVLQMAALTPCKLSIGIEKNVIPSSYATNMSAYFKSWMNFFGKSIGKIELFQKDFLHDECLELIRKATIIFVNNVSFGPQINHELTLRFQDLNDGVRIISPITFCPEKFRITGRSLGNIASIMSIVEIPHLKGPVSWTAKSIAYYVHIIDRRKLENFFVQCVRKNQNGDPTEEQAKRWKKIYDSEPTQFRTVFIQSVEMGDDVATNTSSTLSDEDQESTLSKATNETTLTATSSQTSVNVPKSGEVKSDEVAQKLNLLLSDFAQQYAEMLRIMKQDSYRALVVKEIEEERVRNNQLKNSVSFLNTIINGLENEHLNIIENFNLNSVKYEI